MILIDATNHYTSWFITGYKSINTAGFSSLALDYGPAFLIHTLYSYVIILTTLAPPALAYLYGRKGLYRQEGLWYRTGRLHYPISGQCDR